MKFDLENIDRRIIFLIVFLALSIPLLLKYTVPPAQMNDAELFFKMVDDYQVQAGDYAFVALDFGPNSQAENFPQAQVVIEHLMRKRLPVILFSIYYQAEPFLKMIPERVAAELKDENPTEKWEYGRDWVNLGYRPGASLLIQAIPRSRNLAELFERDVRGNLLRDLPAFSGLRKLEQIKILAQFTSLVGAFDAYLQFFKKEDYVPLFGHGCTSITIPDAFIYLDSGQIKGLLGGVAGAAWYSHLLSQRYPDRKQDQSLVINTGLGVAQLLIIFLIILGNVVAIINRKKRKRV